MLIRSKYALCLCFFFYFFTNKGGNPLLFPSLQSGAHIAECTFLQTGRNLHVFFLLYRTGACCVGFFLFAEREHCCGVFFIFVGFGIFCKYPPSFQRGWAQNVFLFLSLMRAPFDNVYLFRGTQTRFRCLHSL